MRYYVIVLGSAYGARERPGRYVGRAPGSRKIQHVHDVEDASTFSTRAQAHAVMCADVYTTYPSYRYTIEILGGPETVNCLRCEQAMATHNPQMDRICGPCKRIKPDDYAKEDHKRKILARYHAQKEEQKCKNT